MIRSNKLVFDPYDKGWQPIDNGVIVSVKVDKEARPTYGVVLGWHISNGLAEPEVRQPELKLEYKVKMLKTQLCCWVSSTNILGFIQSTRGEQ